MDSIPLVCLTGQVPTSLIGSDAFQECDTVGITRPCTKHNWLVKDVNELAAHHPRGLPHRPVRPSGPGRRRYPEGRPVRHRHLYAAVDCVPSNELPAEGPGRPRADPGGGRADGSGAQAGHLFRRRRHQFRPGSHQLLRELVELTGFPITSTLMGLGAYPASGKNWLGMLGMHGTYEANMAMHDCDVMVCIGARFDDRITGRLNAFSPNSKKIHIDIDPSSINKNVRVDIPILGDVGHVLEDMVRLWRAMPKKPDKSAARRLVDGRSTRWRARNSLCLHERATTSSCRNMRCSASMS